MNANLLRAKMKELGKTQSEVAIAAGMCPNSLSRKLMGLRDFRLSEVERLCLALGISDPTPIFFANNIPSAQHSEVETSRTDRPI